MRKLNIIASNLDPDPKGDSNNPGTIQYDHPPKGEYDTPPTTDEDTEEPGEAPPATKAQIKQAQLGTKHLQDNKPTSICCSSCRDVINTKEDTCILIGTDLGNDVLCHNCYD